jgi:D-proline reductase (dithiol) PrdB
MKPFGNRRALASALLREARRQKHLALADIPEICVLDPDGRILRVLRREQQASVSPAWAWQSTRHDKGEWAHSRAFAERAASPWVCEGRLQTADDLDRYAASLEAGTDGNASPRPSSSPVTGRPPQCKFRPCHSTETLVTRLTDLPPAQAKRLAELECPVFETRPFVSGAKLAQRRVAIVSSAGLVVRGENPFRGRDPDYRAIPAGTKPADLLCSHISINFDRTGFQEDWNVVFPLDRLTELAAEGAIGSVAATHYSFMGATDPVEMEPHVRELAGRLKQDKVDAVILSPV